MFCVVLVKFHRDKSNAAVTGALGDFITRVKTEKRSVFHLMCYCTLGVSKCGEENLSFPLPSSGMGKPWILSGPVDT